MQPRRRDPVGSRFIIEGELDLLARDPGLGRSRHQRPDNHIRVAADHWEFRRRRGRCAGLREKRPVRRIGVKIMPVAASQYGGLKAGIDQLDEQIEAPPLDPRGHRGDEVVDAVEHQEDTADQKPDADRTRCFDRDRCQNHKSGNGEQNGIVAPTRLCPDSMAQTVHGALHHVRRALSQLCRGLGQFPTFS